jgi:hypothetical protein
MFCAAPCVLATVHRLIAWAHGAHRWAILVVTRIDARRARGVAPVWKVQIDGAEMPCSFELCSLS